MQQGRGACADKRPSGTGRHHDRICLDVMLMQVLLFFFIPQRTQGCFKPIPHQGTQALNNRSRLHRSPHNLCACQKCLKYHCRDFIASELGQKFLLGGKVKILVGKDLLLASESANLTDS